MNSIPLDNTAALGHAHNELLKDLGELEAMGTATVIDQKAFVKRLEATSKSLSEHFRLEEQNGYMESVRNRSPYFDHTINKLKGEHVQLLQGMKQLLSAASQGNLPVQSLLAMTREFVDQVRGHETRENLLIEDAFNRDAEAKD